jgi:hypothetical protein
VLVGEIDVQAGLLIAFVEILIAGKELAVGAGAGFATQPDRYRQVANIPTFNIPGMLVHCLLFINPPIISYGRS